MTGWATFSKVFTLTCTLAGLAACDSHKGQSARYHFKYEPKIDVVVPANAPSISQQFRKLPRVPGEENDVDEHTAIDIIAPQGTPVLAAADGTVQVSRYGPAYGHRVEMIHGKDAGGRTIRTLYFHLDSRMVTPGQTVKRGEQIGTLGHSGLLAGTLNHLHYTVVRVRPGGGDEFVDPNLYWMQGPGRITCFDAQASYPAAPFLATYPVVCGR